MDDRRHLNPRRASPFLAAVGLLTIAGATPAHAAGLRVGDRAVAVSLPRLGGSRATLGVGKRVVVMAFVRLGGGDKAAQNSVKVLRELERLKKTLPA